MLRTYESHNEALLRVFYGHSLRGHREKASPASPLLTPGFLVIPSACFLSPVTPPEQQLCALFIRLLSLGVVYIFIVLNH